MGGGGSITTATAAGALDGLNHTMVSKAEVHRGCWNSWGGPGTTGNWRAEAVQHKPTPRPAAPGRHTSARVPLFAQAATDSVFQSQLARHFSRSSTGRSRKLPGCGSAPASFPRPSMGDPNLVACPALLPFEVQAAQQGSLQDCTKAVWPVACCPQHAFECMENGLKRPMQQRHPLQGGFTTVVCPLRQAAPTSPFPSHVNNS